MSLQTATVGASAMLDALLKTAATPEALVLKLFSNNHTPAAADTAGSYTEVTGGGYAAITLTRAGWGAASAGVSTYGTAQTFSFTGTVTVYGYYIVGATSGTLYWAELMYPSGQVFNNTDTETITPKYSLS
jgi:hypothetical protein